MAYYVKVKGRTPDVDHLAELVLRHKDGVDFYECADRLANQIGLAPGDRLRLRHRVQKLLEGTLGQGVYIPVEEED